MSSSIGAPTASGGSASGEAAEPKVKGRRVEIQVAWLGLIAAIVGAVVGGGATFFATWEQSKVQIQQQRDQAASDRAQQDREKRADVYSKFLQAANAYAIATSSMNSYLAVNCTKPGSRCSPDFSSLNTARAAFQASVNDVFVYGSDAAVQDEAALAKTLPESMWTAEQMNMTFNVTDFTQAYQAFETQMCHELPADPRSGCR